MGPSGVVNETPTNVNNVEIKKSRLFYNDISKSDSAKKRSIGNSKKEGNSTFSELKEKSVSDNTHGFKAVVQEEKRKRQIRSDIQQQGSAVRCAVSGSF